MQRFQTKRRSSQRGMSLAETMLSLVVFTIVFLAALALYQAASKAYQTTDAATVQQQNARFAFDRMSETIRDAGANYNPMGKSALADEQIEGAWESAIFVRADFDGQLETPQTTYPMITTGNDEIVGYILQKNGGGSYDITLKMDLTPADRDAVKATSPTNEETATIRVAARTLAEQTDPPYDLTRVSFDATGNPVYQVIASNIFRLSFTYQNAVGGTVISAGANSGSADPQRGIRDDVRKIGINLISMSDRREFGYTDPKTYTPAEGPSTRSYRKFQLEKTILATNMGVKGSRHYNLPSEEIDAPPQLTVCVGHDKYFFIKWQASPTTGIVNYTVRITAASPPITTTADGNGVTEIRWKQTDPTLQAYTFAVAGVAGASVGDYSDPVTITGWHDTTNSKPAAPTGVVPVGGTGNTMNVTWNAVTTNSLTSGGAPSPVTNATACMTAGVSPGPSAPSATAPVWSTAAPDLKEYHVYRGLYPHVIASGAALVPAEPGNRIDDAPYASLTNSTPTSNSFTDNTAAPCGRYFYRIKAFDTANLTAAGDGSATLSQAAFYVPLAGVTPATPSAPSPIGAVTTTPGSPPSIPGTISVTLGWPHITSDSNGRPAATAHYRLVRQQKVGSGAWGTPAMTASNYYERNSMTSADTFPTSNGSGQTIFYRYAVQAVYDCHEVSDTIRETPLPPTDTSPNWYYLTCTFAPSITPTGHSSGIGTLANPWVMDQGDTVRVGVAGTVSNVQFTLREEGTNTIVVGPLTDTIDPFEFVYSNQVDNVLYRLEVQATSPSGCTYTNNFYISDAPPIPPCLLGTSVVSNPATHVAQSGGSPCGPTSPAGPSGSGANKTSTSEYTYTIPNTSLTDDLTLRQIKVDWTPDANHGDATLVAITFPTAAGGTTELGPGANSPPTTNLVNVPATTAIVTRNTTNYQIKIRFSYNKCDLFMPDSPPPVTKICLVYRSPATGTQDRFCNLIGTGTNNPTSCN